MRIAPRPRPWRFLAWYLVAIAEVWLTGRAYESRTLGQTDEHGRQLVADGVRREFARLRAALNPAADAAAARHGLMLRAQNDLAAAREVFASLEAPGPEAISVTIYGSDEELFKQYGFTVENIVERAKKIVNSRDAS